MKNNNRLDRVIVDKIIKYCNICDEAIKEYNATYETYCNKFTFQLAVNMCLLQIGELSAHLSESFKEKHSSIPWRAIKGMRNIQAHDYENLDYDDAWTTITKDVPKLKTDLQKIITEELEGEEI